jgi:AcrR family transcriptional regulator
MPRMRLDTAAVVKAAVELANTEGIEALSLSRLAASLGIQTPSLYNHVDGLPGLYREMALLNNRMLSERLADSAIGKSGADALMGLAQAYRSFIKENPGLYAASLRVPPGNAASDPELEAAQNRAVQIALAVVKSFGLEGDDAVHAVRGLRSMVHGFATLEAAGGFGLPLQCDESFRRLVNMLAAGMVQAAVESRE